MKHISKLILFSSLLLTMFWSCKKDEVKEYFKGGTEPVLTAVTNSSTTDLDLNYNDADKIVLSLSWTNPNYVFTTGISSQDVSYLIEIDTAGANFTNPKRQSIAISKDLSYSITEGQFNDYLLNQLQLDSTMSHNLEIRVKSTLAGGAVPLLSNVISVSAKPYTIPPKVTPPSSGTLYITGSATPARWMAGGDPELLSQKFSKVSPTFYEITVDLIGGGSYLFVPVYGDWSHKYGGVGSNNSNNVNGDDFKAEGGDLLAPAASGTYKIEVDFQRGKFTVTKQ